MEAAGHFYLQEVVILEGGAGLEGLVGLLARHYVTLEGVGQAAAVALLFRQEVVEVGILQGRPQAFSFLSAQAAASLDARYYGT